MIMFSIIMPVYNNEKYFPLAVKSILEQDYTNFELIIVEDGSTDNTPKIADSFMTYDKRVRVIHQKNQWIYASFNNGIREAVGDYIYIVNSDDKIMPGALSLMAKKVAEYYPDVIWTKVLAHSCDEEQNILVYDQFHLDSYVTEEVYYQNKEEVEKAWPYFLSSRLVVNQANLYRREIMQKQKFRNDVYGADVLYNISIANMVNTALVLPQPIYSHYIYGKEKMNASIGKYYAYEHDMQNEIYDGYMSLFQSWGLEYETYVDLMCGKRMSGLTNELRNLRASNCPLTLEEKIEFLFCGCIDETIQECIAITNRREEVESRILSATKELLVEEEIAEESEMYFVYELLEALLCYEKDDNDKSKILNAINHKKNPYQIGISFYEKLFDDRK